LSDVKWDSGFAHVLVNRIPMPPRSPDRGAPGSAPVSRCLKKNGTGWLWRVSSPLLCMAHTDAYCQRLQQHVFWGPLPCCSCAEMHLWKTKTAHQGGCSGTEIHGQVLQIYVPKCASVCVHVGVGL